jgi:Ras-related protein Rab-8A
MLNRFVDGAYNPDISTTLGVEYRKKTVEIQEILVDI